MHTGTCVLNVCMYFVIACIYVMYVCRAMLDAAHYLLRPLILRRVKSEVETLLPPKLETLINCPMSDMQVRSPVCMYVCMLLQIYFPWKPSTHMYSLYVCVYVCTVYNSIFLYCMYGPLI